MDVNRLRELGGIVPAVPVRREVSWTRTGEDGAEHTDRFAIHVRRHSCGTIERIQGRREAEGMSGPALIISESVLLGDDGSEPIPYAIAFQLDPALAKVLIDAVNDVNGFGGATAKN